MMWLLLLASATAAAALEAQPLEGVRIDANGGFVDWHGRTRIFHGVNVAYKKFPWYPAAETFNPYDSLVEEDMQHLKEWGFNVVRLAVMWPGVESSPGKVNKTYMQEISRLAGDLAKYGVRTLSSLHQDLLSRQFCGEGVPDGYIEALLADPASAFSKAQPFPQPVGPALPADADGNPELASCMKEPLFADFYGAEKVGALFNELYTKGTALNDGFLRYWHTVATSFAGASHILGFELLNEPSGYCLHAGDKSCGKKPGLLFDHTVEGKELTPLYAAAAAQIRAADATRPIFYEPRALPMVWSEPFDKLALGNDTQQGLAYHVYCQPDMDGLINSIICNMVQQFAYQEYFDFVKLFRSKGLGSFMSEFGAIGQSQAEHWEVDRLLTVADDNLQSWTYWQLKQFHDLTTANRAESLYDEDGKLEMAKLKLLSRTYAQAIAGKPQRMIFQSWDAFFKLTWNASVTTAPTEIYLNEALHYPLGYDVEIRPHGCFRQEFVGNGLHLHLLDVSVHRYKHGIWQMATCWGSIATVKIRARKTALQVAAYPTLPPPTNEKKKQGSAKAIPTPTTCGSYSCPPHFRPRSRALLCSNLQDFPCSTELCCFVATTLTTTPVTVGGMRYNAWGTVTTTPAPGVAATFTTTPEAGPLLFPAYSGGGLSDKYKVVKEREPVVASVSVSVAAMPLVGVMAVLSMISLTAVGVQRVFRTRSASHQQLILLEEQVVSHDENKFDVEPLLTASVA